jgi:Arc/MetJ family transcription regulator
MRTTIDLPDDLHRLARAVARDEGRTLSETVVRLLRRALGQDGAGAMAAPDQVGLPAVRVGRPLSSDDVRSLDDE